jgi:hypothetical protein
MHIGADSPEDRSLVWYDTRSYPDPEKYLGSPLAMLLRAYKATPGKRIEDPEHPGQFINVHLSDQEFLEAFGKLSPVHGLEIREAASFEALGLPTKDKVGYLYLVPSENGEINDLFDEWTVISTGETVAGEESYK